MFDETWCTAVQHEPWCTAVTSSLDIRVDKSPEAERRALIVSNNSWASHYNVIHITMIHITTWHLLARSFDVRFVLQSSPWASDLRIATTSSIIRPMTSLQTFWVSFIAQNVAIYRRILLANFIRQRLLTGRINLLVLCYCVYKWAW